MSSTSFQIDQANKLADKSEHKAEHKSESSPEHKQEDNIPEDATIGGLNRSNIVPVETRESVPVIDRREIAPVVGKDIELNLKQQYAEPAVRAEEQTALPDSQITTAEKQTKVTEEQYEKSGSLVDAKESKEAGDKNQTTAAKETKIASETPKTESKKEHKEEYKKAHKEAVVEAPQVPGAGGHGKKVQVKHEKKVEKSEK